MPSVSELAFRYFNRVLQKNSNRVFSPVLRTPPIKTKPESKTILYTPLGNRDRRAYILAAKSLLRFCNDFHVVVQNDGSIDADGCREIEEHILGVEIVSSASADENIRSAASPDLLKYLPELFSPRVPTNIKILKLKLLNILYRFKLKRVVMMDSDIICCRSPTFVLNWIKDNRPSYFYSGGGSQQVKEFHRLGFDFSCVDIGNFNSGILGVYHDIDERELIAALERIHARCPELMRGWEIEQSLWAVLLGPRSNSTNLDSLQEGYVTSGWKTYRRMKQVAVLVHFVGAIRFRNFRYLRLARDTYRELKARS